MWAHCRRKRVSTLQDLAAGLKLAVRDEDWQALVRDVTAVVSWHTQRAMNGWAPECARGWCAWAAEACEGCASMVRVCVGEIDWNGGSDWISLCIRDKCWSRRSSRRNDAGLACGLEQIQRVESANAAQRRGAVEHPRSEERKECPSGRLAYAQCAQVGVRQSASRNRSTPHPQVMDQKLV